MQLVFLGLLVDSHEQAFFGSKWKTAKMCRIAGDDSYGEVICALKIYSKTDGQVYVFSLAFPGAKFYIREMAAAI